MGGLEQRDRSGMRTRGSNAPQLIPVHEIEIVFVRSSGPGGQNVNKTATKAQARWCVGSSTAFSEEQKGMIRRAAGKRLNAKDEIIFSADDARTQSQNRDAATLRLQALIAHALAPQKLRKPTKVSRAQKRKRLEEKQYQREKKQARRSLREERE